ncbi:DUF4320 family protein [Acetobacterium woodii]|uniref:DUF4320 family protein n=1 Tax=Acetobacterium woodii (strain ATCC 29683 / DSM 1030 / JCM 2381 / KCTC 1655 / WB1) TaxID=931626 RepID=H6LDF0_ACEWD|nr:DUF4320 family protein [Acetobacterium woodii]AFA47922.1 hypothetical protein Awo_c11380 [Acetobacterium woodii DSM 1030]
MKRDRGVFTTQFAIYFMIAIFIFSMIFGILPVFTQHMKLNRLAAEVVREAELTGATGESVMDRYEETAKRLGLTPKEISFSGTKYIEGTKNVQINDDICVTITQDYKWFSTFLGGEGIDSQITVRALGRSGVYHK